MFRKKIRIDEIKISDDRRPVHYETAKGIAESFNLVGQIHPIVIDEDDNLIAGRHRVEAAKLCEWTTIEASVMEQGPEADLVECDENLQRHGLDALQFSLAVNRRKKAWEAINGKARPGPAKKAKDGISANIALIQESGNFAEETASIAGVSRRTVEVAAAVGEKITEEAIDVVKDTPIADNKKALATIAAAPPRKQAAVARAAVKAGKAPKPKEDREPKNGAVVGWTSDRDAEVTSMMGKLVRLIDERAKHTGSKAGHAKCLGALRAFGEEWKSWRTGKT